ncbi:MAG: single-stranded-DNA-specific exonuclease RecJ [Candidatus Omnitrophota bacterium]
MKKHWVLQPNVDEAQSVASEFKIHPVIASLLLRRGIKTSAEIFRFLNPSLEHLESPFAFSDMQKAVDRIRRAVERKEKILVYGDYDVDGITGSSILFPILKKMGADAEVYIPHRIKEGYGLNRAALEKEVKKKIGLVITVDNGITGADHVAFLQEKGVDVIIVDHHLPKDKVPPAFALVSASVGDKKGDPNLAACGLAFKLGWALLGGFEEVREYLDLVVLGTVADIAPVTGDNRILLKHGLPVLSRTKRLGLRALMDVARVSRGALSYRDIAFGLGPRINASGRMGTPENAFKLLTTDNETLARNLAQLLDDGNRDRQRVEAAAFEEAVDLIERDERAAQEKILVLSSPDWHEGVLGIVASRLVDRYQKPSIVISVREGIGKGSGRSVPLFSLFDCVLRCEDFLMNFGGHAQACGLTIKGENIQPFRSRLNEFAGREFQPPAAFAKLDVESELPLTELDMTFLRDLERIAPFGPGNKKPLFLSRGLRLKGNAKKRGQDTLQCWMTDEAGKTTCEVVGFRAWRRWNGVRTDGLVDIVHQPALKEFNGIPSIQLELEDWDQAGA